MTTSRWFMRLAIWAVPLPFLMNTAGWMLTESGRQPWIVQGVQLTRQGVSPSLDVASLAVSLVLFFLLYAVLAVVDIVLMLRYARRDLGPGRSSDEPEEPLPAPSY
ncbi:MAG TPA: cytochrome ubiquinol oxidase subunit I [Pseudonocardiaceae bacterium]|nr:cytochrome ubiquinol oxidase subunit I [Pseudonocardiaceae bacterium]